MLGLWGIGSSVLSLTLHLAFEVRPRGPPCGAAAARGAGSDPALVRRRADYRAGRARLDAAGAVYFRDPDGHMLEYLTMLEEDPRPAAGIVPTLSGPALEHFDRHHIPGRSADTAGVYGALGVHLTVTDLDRSVAFYEDAIGLQLHGREGPVAVMGAGGEDLLKLVEEPGARPAGRHAGLYHSRCCTSRGGSSRALRSGWS